MQFDCGVSIRQEGNIAAGGGTWGGTFKRDVYTGYRAASQVYVRAIHLCQGKKILVADFEQTAGCTRYTRNVINVQRVRTVI